MNTPYIKKRNENGEVTNPITKQNPYLNHHPSRRVRNAEFHNQRHRGNNAGHAIVVIGTDKYFKTLQQIPVRINGKFAGMRTIEHSRRTL